MILPALFASLEDLAQTWCVADDLERDQLMTAAPDEELRSLIERVSPYFEEINSYLDHHQDEEACNLGMLAEAACEAQFDLERRT